jgi:hypothetical protein
MFPSFILARLYVKGSLKNDDQGFEFSLQNNIDSATLVNVGPIIVDGDVYEAANLKVISKNQERNGDQISRENSFPIQIGAQFRIVVPGKSLAPGEHHIKLTANTREIGKVKFDFKDTTV